MIMSKEKNIADFAEWVQVLFCKISICAPPCGTNSMGTQSFNNQHWRGGILLSCHSKNAWDKDTLEIQIENKYYLIAGNSMHNFENTLPAMQSQLAAQAQRGAKLMYCNKKPLFL